MQQHGDGSPNVVHAYLLLILQNFSSSRRMTSFQVVLLVWVSLLPGASLAWVFTSSGGPRRGRTPALVVPVPAWWPARAHPSSSSLSSLALAGSDSAATAKVELGECAGDAASIQEAAAFLVDAFWLGSGRQRMPPAQDNDEMPVASEAVRSSILQDQTEDLMDKFGERLGERLLDAGIILAKENNNEIVGMVCLTETLLEQNDDGSSVKVLQASNAENLLKETLASLSPQQRRQYKNAFAQQLAQELLSSPSLSRTSICCLSNLAVSPAVRRRGVARQLCEACEQVARETWSYSELYLLVEKDNAAARRLYEGKLGYKPVCTLPQEAALRVNLESGGLVETHVDTLVLVKKLQ